MKELQLEINDGIAVLTINREEKLNALSQAMFEQLGVLFDEISNNPEARVLIITGSGSKAFIAGADLSLMLDFTSATAEAASFQNSMIFEKLEQMPIPVIAAINGFAFGGGLELALTCDIRIASENAVFSFPEIGLGLIPGSTGTQRLPRIAGSTFASQMILTGARFDAQTAMQHNIVSEVLPSEELMPRAMKLATKMKSHSAYALQLAKDAMIHGSRVSLLEGIQIESNRFGQCFSHPECFDSIKKFLNRN